MANGTKATRKKEIREGVENVLTRMDEALVENERLTHERDEALAACDRMRQERDEAFKDVAAVKLKVTELEMRIAVLSAEKDAAERYLKREGEERAFYHTYSIDVCHNLNTVADLNAQMQRVIGDLLARASAAGQQAERLVHQEPVNEFAKRAAEGSPLPMVEAPRFLAKPPSDNEGEQS